MEQFLKGVLGPRLSLVADYVRDNTVLADVGTDHAYLPTYLITHNKIQSAIACDLRKGPLENAKQTILQYGCSEKIECRLGDGLSPICEGEVQDVTIAGMGGETIVSILQKCPWIQDSNIRIIVQPMTHIEDVHRYAYEKGFDIIEEQAITEQHHSYVVMVLQFSGIEKKKYSDIDLFLGCLKATSEDNIMYINCVKKRFQKQKDGLLSKQILTKNDEKQIESLTHYMEEIEQRICEENI